MTFNVDHSKLEPGIYINGSKVVGDKEIITYDIRVCKPYEHRVLNNVALHSIEHIMATYLEEEVAKYEGYSRIYFGPMGCQTGFYLLVASPIGEIEPEKKVLQMIKDACARAIKEKKVPFTDAKECGNNRTLRYDHDTQSILCFMSRLANGIKKYHYIGEDTEVIAHYVVRFGKTSVIVETDVVSYEEICTMAEGSTPTEFTKALRKLVEERRRS